MLKKEISKIDWENKTAQEIKNQVRGLNPIMGAYTTYNGKKIKIWKADKIETQNFAEEHPEFKNHIDRLRNIIGGTIIFSDSKKGLYVKAKNDIIIIQEVQGENSKKMNIQDFLRGNPLKMGEVLE